VTITKAVDENYKATEEVVVFNNDEVVHVSVEAKNYTSADVFEAKWFLDGKEYDSVKYSFERSGETGKSEWGDDRIVIGAYHKSNAYFVVILGQEGYMIPQIMDLVSGSV